MNAQNILKKFLQIFDTWENIANGWLGDLDWRLVQLKILKIKTEAI